MRYIGKVARPVRQMRTYCRPPSAAVGISAPTATCTEQTTFSLRNLDEVLEDMRMAAAQASDRIQKLFVMDGDALCMPMDHWRAILKLAYQFTQGSVEYPAMPWPETFLSSPGDE